MKAVVAREFGPPSSFRLEEIPDPAPGPGQARIAIKAAAVNFVDVLVAAGRYQVKPPLPLIPGGEYAGVVESVGEGVTTVALGDRVCGGGLGAGAHAEMTVADAASVYRIPPSMSFLDAATFRMSNITAYHALVQRAALKAGETVLVLAAGGAVGRAAVQIAKALGARVIASASSEAKRALASHAGADDVIDSAASDWREQIKSLTAGRGGDVVVDPVGGEALEPAFRSLAWGGRHLVIGFAGGGIPALRANLALLKGAALVGVDVRQFMLHEPEQSAANVRALIDLWNEGRLTAPPAQTYSLARFEEAMKAASDRATTGRVILDMSL